LSLSIPIFFCKRSRHFRISSFDERAAIEFAVMQDERRRRNIKSTGSTRAKAKFDDQIIAIAAIEGATIIYRMMKILKKWPMPDLMSWA
jgi:hypothetical protein